MARAFWKEGIRFECQGTGRCCTARGLYGFVYVECEDRVRLAQHLGLSAEEFIAAHCEMTDGYYHLKGPDKDCAFLLDHQCSVYSARPRQCRTWPFWRENLASKKAWNRDVVGFCAGVGKGRLHTAEEIRAIMTEQEAAQDTE